MEKVDGVGGIFFRAADPAALSEWYQTHLGIDPVPTDFESMPWQTEAGTTVFSPFAADTDYFPAEKQMMINFRVRDLDAMVAQLRGAGVEVTLTETLPIGRFARLFDPEGNALELWEPSPAG